MGNGQMHQMSEQPIRTTTVAVAEQQRVDMEQAQSLQLPLPSGITAPADDATTPSVTPPAPAVNDAGIEATAVPSSFDASVDESSGNSELPSDARLTPPPSSSTTLLPSLSARGRAFPAIERASLSSSVSKSPSPSPRQPPSPATPSLSSPLPPPSPSAASSSSLPSAATRSVSSVSISTSSPTPSSTTALLTTSLTLPPATASASTSPIFSALSAPAPITIPPVLSPIVVAAGRPSWQLDNNEHRSLICRFCGGPTCKHEDYTRQPNYRTAAAIVGLNSTYITPHLIAMQRPSTQLIHTHNIAQQFNNLNITAIINCQQTGEHALCGGGIQPHGFSYHPDDLPLTHHYNFGWVDMGVPPIERMLNIVQVMAMHESRGGRVAVHCHAGYGRTGMVIACYLVFAHHYSGEMAITTVRQQREGSVQTKEQKRFCYRFEQYIKHLRYHYHITTTSAPAAAVSSATTATTLAVSSSKSGVLPPLSPPSAGNQSFQPLSPTPALPPSLSFPLVPPSLSSVLTNQRLFLHGAERQQYRYVSKLVSTLVAAIEMCGYDRLCEEIEQRAVAVGAANGSGGGSGGVKERGSFLLHLPFDWTSSWTLEDSSTLDKIKHGANLNDYTAVHTATSPFILLVALLHFLTQLTTPLLPYYSYSASLPTTLSPSLSTVLQRSTIPTLHCLVRMLHSLQFVALPRSSDVRPIATFVVLAFAFALLHPHCAVPASLTLLVPANREAEPRVRRKEGVEGKDEGGEGGVRTEAEVAEEEEEGASLGSMLCFMSVLLTEWHEEHSEWTKREEEDRQSRRVGVRKGERWWMGPDALSPSHANTAAAAGSAAPEGKVKTPRLTKPSSSRRNSGKRSARSSNSRRGSHKQPVTNAADPDKVAAAASAPVAATNESAEKTVGNECSEERKEQPEQTASDQPAIVPLPTPRGSKRGSGNRPILPPLKITRNLSNES